MIYQSHYLHPAEHIIPLHEMPHRLANWSIWNYFMPEFPSKFRAIMKSIFDNHSCLAKIKRQPNHKINFLLTWSPLAFSWKPYQIRKKGERIFSIHGSGIIVLISIVLPSLTLQNMQSNIFKVNKDGWLMKPLYTVSKSLGHVKWAITVATDNNSIL